MLVSCAFCPGCRARRSASWAVRLEDEERSWDRSCFLTLTIRDGLDPKLDPPSPERLRRRDLQLFFKKLRKAGLKFKYYAVGEYGERSARAHYHLLVFGIDVRDRVAVEAAWPWGLVDFGRLEAASVRYVTGYVMKAPLGRLRLHEERQGNAPPFSVMSRGLGARGCDARKHTIVTQGCIRSGATRMVPPRFYLARLSESERLQYKLAVREEALRAANARVGDGKPYLLNNQLDRAEVARADFNARRKPRGVL